MTCHVSGFSKRVTLPTVGLSTCVLGVLLAFSSGAGAQSLSGMLEAARQFDATYLSDTAAARATYAAAKLDNASTLPKVSLVSSVTQSNVYVSGETTDTLSRYIGVISLTLAIQRELCSGSQESAVRRADRRNFATRCKPVSNHSGCAGLL